MGQRLIALLTEAFGVNRLHNSTSLIFSGYLINSLHGVIYDAHTLGILNEITLLGISL